MAPATESDVEVLDEIAQLEAMARLDAPPSGDVSPAQPARITVSRTSSEDIRDRQIYMSLDGERIATLMFGESVTKEIEPGSHYLRANNTLFWKTVDVDVKPGEHVHFIVVNRAGAGTYVMLGLFGAGPIYLTLRREDAPVG